jgi:hypothetical protein
VPGLRKGGVGGFAQELRRTGAKAPSRFKRDCAKRISRACMVGEVVSPLVSVPESSRMARGASGLAEVRSGEGMDERNVAEYMSGAVAQVASYSLEAASYSLVIAFL